MDKETKNYFFFLPVLQDVEELIQCLANVFKHGTENEKSEASERVISFLFFSAVYLLC